MERKTQRFAWPLALTVLASLHYGGTTLAAEPGTPASPYPPGGATPAPTPAPETQPPQEVTNASSGFIMVGGKQAFFITSIAGYPVDKRAEDIKNRIRGVIQPGDSNTAVKISPADVSVRFVNGGPVIYIKETAIVTVANEDADRAHTDPAVLANQWADSLRTAIVNYKVGETLPDDWITLKPGSYAGSRVAVVKGNKVMTNVGNITYSVKNGVVTLNGAVGSNFERAMAEVAVRRIPGVVEVRNNIMVRAKYKIQPPRSKDAELQKQVGEQLQQVIEY